MLREIFLGLGAIGLVILFCILLLLPLLCTIILGTFIATYLGLNGLVWWSFVILFYIIVMGLISATTTVVK